MHQWAVLCMNGTTKQAFDFGSISPVKYFFTVALLLGVLFAFISQGDSPDQLFIFTLIQWQLQTGLPITLLILSHMLLLRFKKFETLNPWLQLFISGLIGVLLFTPFALTLDFAFGSNEYSKQHVMSQLVDELGGVGPPVIISWLAMNAPWILGYRIKQADALAEGHDLTPSSEQKAVNKNNDAIKAAVPLFDMLPSSIGNDIVFIKAELHYIEVNTTQGHALILYNLRDAMKELMYLPGLQTHRSFWINLKHFKSIKKQGRQGLILMNDGHEIPISRTQLKTVTEACKSWLEKLN